jgi:predicted RNA binding protein YcfA (HicA-like mRNA interferase family)
MGKRSKRLVPLSAREIVRRLSRTGFVEDGQRGSHLRMWRESDRRLVIVPMHQGDVPKGTLRGIVRDAGLSVEEFNELDS